MRIEIEIMRYLDNEILRFLLGWRRLLMTSVLISHFLISSFSQSQKFFNLTADEVRIDSLLPVFNYAYPLGSHYADSTYTVAIEYPEFVPMSREEIKNVECLMRNVDLPALPNIHQSISVDRKQGTLHIGFVPLVVRDGQYMKLVSFKLDVRSKMEDGRGNRWYDLNGRRLQQKPDQKGVYLKNGRKVVVH